MNPPNILTWAGVPDFTRFIHRSRSYQGTIPVKLSTADLCSVTNQCVYTSVWINMNKHEVFKHAVPSWLTPLLLNLLSVLLLWHITLYGVALVYSNYSSLLFICFLLICMRHFLVNDQRSYLLRWKSTWKVTIISVCFFHISILFLTNTHIISAHTYTCTQTHTHKHMHTYNN